MGFFNKNKIEDIWVVVGLGNFGTEYDGTRHNCGFAVVDKLAQLYKTDFTKKKFKGVIAEAKQKNTKIIIVKPTTYMNLSGECLQEVIHWYKIDETHLIVVHDDIDLDLGKIRIKVGGSAGTHNGMKSVLNNTKTDEFARVKIGIGKNPTQMDLAKYVLGHFTAEEKPLIEETIQRATDAVDCIIKNGAQDAMGKYNIRTKE